MPLRKHLLYSGVNKMKLSLIELASCLGILFSFIEDPYDNLLWVSWWGRRGYASVCHGEGGSKYPNSIIPSRRGTPFRAVYKLIPCTNMMYVPWLLDVCAGASHKHLDTSTDECTTLFQVKFTFNWDKLVCASLNEKWNESVKWGDFQRQRLTALLGWHSKGESQCCQKCPSPCCAGYFVQQTKISIS